MNWKAYYLEGQRQGYFINYTKPASLKSAYQRWKKNNKLAIMNRKNKQDYMMDAFTEFFFFFLIKDCQILDLV